MTRRHFAIPCEGEALAATLDEATGRVGLLIATGGNEVRSGAFAGQARLAARIAAAGYPVLRFDRRGVGDSSGANSGFTGSTPEIGAALAALRAQAPQVKRVVAFGNCDAASALLLAGGAGADALVLANPWTFDSADEAPAPQAVRARYAAKLKNPRELLRLLGGGVSLPKLAVGLRRALSAPVSPSGLLWNLQSGFAPFGGNTAILLAPKDRTAQAFMAAWPESADLWQVCADADHGFSSAATSDWLFSQLHSVLQEQTRQLDMG